MFVSLRMISLPAARESERDTLVADLRRIGAAIAGVRSAWVAPVSPVAVINAGHIVWRTTFATEREAIAAPFDPVWRGDIAPLLADTQVSSIGYRLTRSLVQPAGAGIWRALIFRVMPDGLARVKQLEDALLLMPDHVTSIRSWALSPVAWVEGPKAFTHIWEQEFDSIEGLTGEYMTHPVHWGLVDAFFDAECPEYIVDPQLIQVVGAIDRTIME